VDRPVEVDRALVLLWTALGVTCISMVAMLVDLDEDDPLGVFMAMYVVIVLFDAMLIWLIGRRHNWARILFLVLVVVSAPFLFTEVPQSALEWTATIAGVISCALEVLALFWLFRSDGADWFKA